VQEIAEVGWLGQLFQDNRLCRDRRDGIAGNAARTLGQPAVHPDLVVRATSLLGRIRRGLSATGPMGHLGTRPCAGPADRAVALAALLFVFLPQPTGAAILLIAVELLVVLAGIEFLGRPGPTPITSSA
jgi:hypothetical protein